MRIGYLVHNLNDPSVERRCKMFELGGAQVTLAGFTRDADLRGDVASRKPLILGQSADAAFGRRIMATLGNAIDSRQVRRRFADCDVIIARNLEQLAIARPLVGSRTLAYECLDIHRMLVGDNLPARTVRAVEGKLLPRVDLLITSSPAFIRHHFAGRLLKAKTLLVENRLLIEGEPAPPQEPPPAPPWRIGWFGMLRCRRTLDFLTDLARAGEGSIEVLIAGKPSPAELPDLEQRAANTPGVRFAGPYRYEDLPGLYGQVHFAWTIDWFEEGVNSSWLLPNRIYEAVAHGTVPIALANIEVGRWLAARETGLLVEEPGGAGDRLLSMSEGEYALLRQSAAAVPRADVVAGVDQCRDLVAEIAQARR